MAEIVTEGHRFSFLYFGQLTHPLTFYDALVSVREVPAGLDSRITTGMLARITERFEGGDMLIWRVRFVAALPGDCFEIDPIQLSGLKFAVLS